jgi:hypothetical protein
MKIVEVFLVSLIPIYYLYTDVSFLPPPKALPEVGLRSAPSLLIS